MFKKRWLIGLLIVILIIIGISLIVVKLNGKDKNVEIEKELYCNTDADCMPSICCHPNSCVNKDFANSCDDGLICSAECRPGTLDCGQGSCLCVNHKCNAVFK